MIGYTYAQLLQSMQDWPVNSGTNYVGNIPRFIELGELRLVRELNLEIFDVTDSSFTLGTGDTIIDKPAHLVSVRTLRLAAVTGTTSQAANPTALCASQATFATATAMTFNGTLGAAPVAIAIPAQLTVIDTTGGSTGGGVIVTAHGLDYGGLVRTETLISVNGQTVTGLTRWSEVTSLTCSNGSTPQTLSVGIAAVAQATLGRSFPLYKRNWDYVNNFASDPAVTSPPRYYAEVDSNTWQIAQASDQNYAAVVRFIMRPESIVTAGTSWLGDRCGDLLLQCGLMEAENFLKADDRFADIQGDYNAKLQVARMELRNSIRVGDYSPVKPAAAPTQG